MNHPVSSTGVNNSPYALQDVSPAVHQGANDQKIIQVQTRVEVEIAK